MYGVQLNLDHGIHVYRMVFTTRENADTWIRSHVLSDYLTVIEMQVDPGVDPAERWAENHRRGSTG